MSNLGEKVVKNFPYENDTVIPEPILYSIDCHVQIKLWNMYLQGKFQR